MSQPTAEQVSRTPVVYTIPGMEAVSVRRDLTFQSADGAPLAMDLYAPAQASSSVPRAAVVLVSGYPDPGVERILGRKFKELRSSVCWAQLIAASGVAAVVSTNRQPEADLSALLRHLDAQAQGLGIDRHRLGIWASSGNGPLALSRLMKTHATRPRCAALLYPLLMDLEGATAVETLSATYRFVNPCTGRTLSDLADDIPIFVARAGQDETPRLNESLDQFAAAALAANLPLTLVNHPTGPHAFDLFDDGKGSRAVVRAVLAFLRDRLTSAGQEPEARVQEIKRKLFS